MSATLTTSKSSSSLKVLSDESLEILHARGQAKRQGGYRAVSNTSYTTADSLDSEATVLVPDELDSLETLQFLELNETTASIVWGHFLDRKKEFPHRASVLNSAKRYVTSIQGNGVTDNDDWVGIMRRIGMTSNFQARLMRDEMKEMRLSGSLKQWIFEMMDIRYEFLATLDNVIQAQPISTLAHKSSRPGLGGFGTKSAPEIPPRGSSQASKAPELGSFKAPKPHVATASDDPPKQLDYHVMMLKGIARPRLDRSFEADGQLDFGSIASTPPGDFSRGFAGLYFTKNYEVAWKYAQWAQTIVDGNVVPVEILHVAVPDHLMSSVQELYGDQWRRFVWANRRGGKMPADLIYLEDYQWLVGAINHSSNDQIRRMTSPSELMIWKLANNQTTSQFFAGNNAIIRLMNEHCVGKVWRTVVQAENKGKGKA